MEANTVIDKIEIECPECGNACKIYTYADDDVVFCPFCGEPIVTDIEPDEDFDEDEDDDTWPTGGC